MQSKTSAMQQAAPYLGLGVQLASTVLVCGAVGYWVDIQFLSSPMGVLTGVVVGSVVGMVQFFRTVQRLSQRKELSNEIENER